MLVCAPTGAGKTVVGEFAVHLALRAGGRKCFYTTPIKALSNQKYHDLVDRYGADQVGLLTGDNAINGDAPVVVMTTEVLRNMLYAGSATLRRPRLRGDGRGALPRRPVPRRGLGRGDHPPAGSRSRWSRCRRPCPTPRSSPTGWSPCAARPRSWSASTGRCRCGSTCWSASGCSTCSTTPRRPRSTRCTRSCCATPGRLMRRLELADGPRGGRRGGGAAGAGSGRRAADIVERLDRDGPAAGDPVHLQPGRLRRRRAAVPATPGCG